MSSSLMKWLGMLMIWFLFALIAFHSCVKDSCGIAQEETEEALPVPVEEVQRYPVDFQWDKAQAQVNEGYEAIRDRLLNEMSDDNKLVITGKYFESETAPEGFSSMGMARATDFRKLIGDGIPDDRITLTDLKQRDLASAQKGFFESLEYEWQEADAEEETEIIQSSPDEIIIRFPYASAVKEVNPIVDEYLDQLAARLSQTTERIEITGHTDNRGNAASNMVLSERRAKAIRDALREKGVENGRMEVKWKGQTDAMSSNDTEEGRHNNRRVILRILK